MLYYTLHSDTMNGEMNCKIIFLMYQKAKDGECLTIMQRLMLTEERLGIVKGRLLKILEHHLMLVIL